MTGPTEAAFRSHFLRSWECANPVVHRNCVASYGHYRSLGVLDDQEICAQLRQEQNGKV